MEKRSDLLKYGSTLLQEENVYRVSFIDGIYNGIDVSGIKIIASNDAEAIVVLYDYLNTTAKYYNPIDHFSCIDNDDDVTVHVSDRFNIDDLRLIREPRASVILKLNK